MMREDFNFAVCQMNLIYFDFCFCSLQSCKDCSILSLQSSTLNAVCLFLFLSPYSLTFQMSSFETPHVKLLHDLIKSFVLKDQISNCHEFQSNYPWEMQKSLNFYSNFLCYLVSFSND